MKEKTRYSDEELAEFKQIILERLEKSKKLYEDLTQSIRSDEEKGGDEAGIYDNGAGVLALETMSIQAQKEIKYIQALEAALVRIENKTYGISVKSGKLIPKERLRLMPHTTQTVEDKVSK
ncbi:MAG: TraR/DksA family transcriptional regulator [Paludibacteraceae bacterium]|nr:TraR/DksA family transcriptional regulator [Paludibacteraceae bacterium]